MRIVVIGEGLTGALEGAEVVVDVSNSQTFEDAAAREFFTRSATNLLADEPGDLAGVPRLTPVEQMTPAAAARAR
ncbi:hypothetical protein [Mycolicibacterium fluoranthenivorans]|uniref:Uncharacterized protein n=1 Tax=Mycolicibacterium fluoranthenivorans TaxID=258505 RepID=A0A7X5ZAS6_9MYCO|nr:hypothetical protein [Mycolicibacterium fluoranthenivorans]MCV7355101.1 hypothetical protein [Mycolicibacterium fluoranthenivorans]NIH93791.1 hypothetical protein [Mycolicibacterium fluoranthenivorans]